ncbi:MAG TPA: YHYH protein [Alphaproteobacteria bacterium]|nr:YHYH protein [Alphaproteobacteria bacterium]
MSARRLYLALLAALAAPTFVFAATSSQHVLSDADLLALAANPYNSGELPLGDNHYVLDGPKKGYIYLCHTMDGDRGGAQIAGNWIHGTTWNSFAKLSVLGEVNWPTAQFSNQLSGDTRDLVSNGLPSHPTGIFPIQSSDPASQYDRNPNSIKLQSLHDSLPANPKYSETPNCMSGEVGIMLTGVPLFNGFDAAMRDAAAHEVQDKCSGHPQQAGQYHYHSLSACMKDISEKTVLGYALDGFPITGPLVAPGRYLVTDNLDVCHGITSEIIEDGQPKVIYHYVMTQDFPYSVSCFRGTPSRLGPSDGGPRSNQMGKQRSQQGGDLGQVQQNMQQQMRMQGGPQNGQQQMPGQQQMQQPPMQTRVMGTMGSAVPPPPDEAIAPCQGLAQGARCGFISRRGDTIQGRCLPPPGQSVLACVPAQ